MSRGKELHVLQQDRQLRDKNERDVVDPKDVGQLHLSVNRRDVFRRTYLCPSHINTELDVPLMGTCAVSAGEQAQSNIPNESGLLMQSQLSVLPASALNYGKEVTCPRSERRI